MRVLMDKAHARDFMEVFSYYESAKAVVHCLEMDNDTEAWMEAVDDCDEIGERVFTLVKAVVDEADLRLIEGIPDPKVPGGLEFLFFGEGERCRELFSRCRFAEEAASMPRSVFAKGTMTLEERSKARKEWAERRRCYRREFIEGLEFVRVEK